jgi:hypothetical protein
LTKGDAFSPWCTVRVVVAASLASRRCCYSELSQGVAPSINPPSYVITRQAGVASTSGVWIVVSWNYLARVPRPALQKPGVVVRFTFNLAKGVVVPG